MKGGYQILDLTGATAGSPVEVKGIYKAAAGNNGKPVMILTNDGQRVYAEIAEDDGDYVTCYISAEGKTVNITIKSDDSVTTVISDPGASILGLEQAVNEIAGNIGDVDDLTTTSKEVVGAVNELNSNKASLGDVSKVSIDSAYAIASTNACVYSIGKIGILHLQNIRNVPTDSAYHKIGVLPGGIVPEKEAVFCSTFINAAGNFVIRTNGDIEISCSNTDALYLTADIPFKAAN